MIRSKGMELYINELNEDLGDENGKEIKEKIKENIEDILEKKDYRVEKIEED